MKNHVHMLYMSMFGCRKVSAVESNSVYSHVHRALHVQVHSPWLTTCFFV